MQKKNYENPNRAGRVKKIRPEPGPARIRPGPVDTSTVYVYVYIVYVYVVLTRVYAIVTPTVPWGVTSNTGSLYFNKSTMIGLGPYAGIPSALGPINRWPQWPIKSAIQIIYVSHLLLFSLFLVYTLRILGYEPGNFIKFIPLNFVLSTVCTSTALGPRVGYTTRVLRLVVRHASITQLCIVT